VRNLETHLVSGFFNLTMTPRLKFISEGRSWRSVLTDDFFEKLEARRSDINKIKVASFRDVVKTVSAL